MTSFRILPEASEELEACVSYYNSQQSKLGTEFLAEFERSAERILKLPNAARLVGEGVRSRAIQRTFPVTVLAVWFSGCNGSSRARYLAQVS